MKRCIFIITALIFTICITNFSFGQFNKYELLLESYDQASYIETYRAFPTQISIQNDSLQPSQYFQLMIKIVTDVAVNSNQSNYNGTWLMPDSLYPSIELSDAIYSKMIGREEYIQFFNDLLASYPDSSKLPEALSFRNENFRFIDAYYLALVISRFYYSYRYLPTIVDPKVVSPIGLFPWAVNDSLRRGKYLSNIQNRERDNQRKNSEYYYTGSMDYEIYKIGKEVVGNETNQYNAGENIYFYASSLMDQREYGAYYDYENNFGKVYNSYEMMRFMQGTSERPQYPKYALYPAVGIAHGYDETGFGGIIYINDMGWINAEYHYLYGSDYHLNRFLRFITKDEPFPSIRNTATITPGREVIRGVNDIIKLSTATTDTRAFWINPSDILTYGPEYIIETAKSGGFNTIIVTVKSFMGYYYFNFDDPVYDGLRVKEDAINTLPQLAKTNGIRLLLAIHSLADYYSNLEREHGLLFLGRFAPGLTTNFFITPCYDAHKEFTKEVIKQLYEKYSFDGIVFIRNYTFYDGWGNPECSVYSLPDKASKETFLAEYVNDLGTYAKSLDNNKQTYYLTVSQTLGYNVQDLAEFEEPDPSKIDPNSFDGIILSVNGFTWLFDETYYNLDKVFNKYFSTNFPIYITASLSKEWEYPPEFYRGIARYYANLNSAGIIIIANNSGEGELGPAFVKQHYGKLNQIKFMDPPPEQNVITSLKDDKTDLGAIPNTIVLLQNYPNPFNPATTITYSLLERASVTLKVYDMLGREIALLVNESKPRGLYKVNFNGSALPSGIYLYRLQSGNFTETKKFILMK